MSVSAIVQRRREALLRDFVRNAVPPLLQVENPSILGQLTFLEEFEEDEEEIPLCRRAPGSVVIRQGPGNPDSEATLWVAASYRGYRSAYRAFLKQVYGVTATKSDLAPYDVDHLLNRARSAAGTSFLRIEAIASGANRSWGSAFEKYASTDAISKNRSERRLMSYVIAAKVAGLSPPSGPTDTAAIDTIANWFAARGLNRQEVRDGLMNMLTHVERNQ